MTTDRRSWRVGTGLLAAAAALLGALAAPASGAPAPTPAATDAGQIGIRLLDAPVGRKDDPRAQIYIVDHLQPGATIRRRVEVANTTDSAARIAVYPAAATVEDGVFGFADDRTHNELTSWTTVRPDVLDVPSGGTATAEVTVAVPADAGGGERYGVVWAEHVSAAPTGGGVGAVSRVGVRMYLSVGGPVEPPSAFEVDTLTARRLDDGTPVVEALVHNTGRRALDMRGELQLSDGPGGLSAGPWTVRIALRSGQLERAVEGEIRFPDALGAAAPQVRARQVPLTQHERVAMLVAIALVLLLMLALLCCPFWSRSRAPSAFAGVAFGLVLWMGRNSHP